MKTALITAASALLMAGGAAPAAQASYGTHRGICHLNGEAQPCFIRHIGPGLHQVTWLSSDFVAIYAETSAGSYVESTNGFRTPAQVTGGCTKPTNGCRLRFVTHRATTVLPALYALN